MAAESRCPEPSPGLSRIQRTSAGIRSATGARLSSLEPPQRISDPCIAERCNAFRTDRRALRRRRHPTKRRNARLGAEDRLLEGLWRLPERTTARIGVRWRDYETPLPIPCPAKRLGAGARTLSRPLTAGDMGASMAANLADVEGKVVGLAEAIPEAKYGWSPTDDVRTVSEVLLHVAAANHFFSSRIGGPKAPADAGDWEKNITSKTEAVCEAEGIVRRDQGRAEGRRSGQAHQAVRWARRHGRRLRADRCRTRARTLGPTDRLRAFERRDSPVVRMI